jgi:hypothetical protein
MTIIEDSLNNNIKLCQCGCKQEVSGSYRDGKKNKWIERKFIHGHYTRILDRRGDKNPNWKGGRVAQGKGYMKILKHDHPNNVDGYVKEHRLTYEEYYNCCLLPWTDIHHINEIKNDNKIENLYTVFHSKHKNLHRKDMSDRYCLLCNSDKTYVKKNGIYNWLKYEDGFICKRCYRKRYYKKKSC